MAPAISLIAVEEVLQRLYLGGATEGGALRVEDRKKAREVVSLLDQMSRLGRRDLVVDAAAGHAYLGLIAAELLGIGRLVVIERDPRRAEKCRAAAARLRVPLDLEVRVGEVGDRASWPQAPDAVLGLHACGSASDALLDGAIAARTRWLLLVPCCYDNAMPSVARAEARATAMGMPRQAEVRRKFIESLVDAERTLRLEAAGYEVWGVPFVTKQVTPHNLLLRARRVAEPTRMAEAAAQLERLLGRPTQVASAGSNIG